MQPGENHLFPVIYYLTANLSAERNLSNISLIEKNVQLLMKKDCQKKSSGKLEQIYEQKKMFIKFSPSDKFYGYIKRYIRYVL